MIPPFPSQDLAKLVLGYLAEEQLMTAYDEFLQASPYLDAHKNEYDRICMISLRNILAEYRAIKIYVETCKPIPLRKKLLQCSNLLEVVKFIICHIDINKIDMQDESDGRIRCKKSDVQTKSDEKTTTLETSVETTLTTDLPGNSVTNKKKHLKVLEKMSHQTDINELKQCSQGPRNSLNEQNPSFDNSNSLQIKNNNVSSIPYTHNLSTKPDSLESAQKIEEFNDILKIICNNNKSIAENQSSSHSNNDVSRRMSFADAEKTSITVSDSSSCSDSTVQVVTTRNVKSVPNVFVNAQGSLTPQVVLENVKPPCNSFHSHNKNIDESVANKELYSRTVGLMRPKPEITILSNVRVENSLGNNDKPIPPSVLRNTTSTPLPQVQQSILINGTPAYKGLTQTGPRRNFTREEIMSMPTIILVPLSGPPQITEENQSQIITSRNVAPATVSNSTASPLGPLTIDVPPNNLTQEKETLINIQKDNENNSGIVSTAPLMKNSSLPKESVTNNITTPQVLPIIKKSSSTPRRNAHVRVLDFTTPRRILHDTIEEHASNVNINNSGEKLQLINTEINNCNSVTSNDKIDYDIKNDNSIDINESQKDNNIEKKMPSKKANWDADLRALAVINNNEDDDFGISLKPKPTPKSNTTKKKKKNITSEKMSKYDNGEVKKSVSKKKGITTKNKSSKLKSDEVLEEEYLKKADEVMDMPIKPTINIISGSKWSTQNNEKAQSNLNEDQNDTPEMERLSLQNAIGTKLNISDLLETPYKQALYDIQMETPRFLGPDIPDDPMSDIKIMNIPTPRFLNTPNLSFTPKPVQATPSSYSSRPTDYSSGGSYYKPDDQDYEPVSDDLGFPVSISRTKELSIHKGEQTKDSKNDAEKENKDINPVKSSRPVRKCTKNVSYYNSPNLSCKTKEDKGDLISSSSEINDLINSGKSIEVGDSMNASKDIKSAQTTKSDNKNKPNSSKKFISPIRKVTSKNFMKIKPRQTPKKELGRSRRTTRDTPEDALSKSQIRKKVSTKEKSTKEKFTITPVVTSVPTKSRRKSSTPRKLHCTKTLNSDNIVHHSTEAINKKDKPQTVSCVHDSDTDQLSLRWSDDGSQDAKLKESQINTVTNECEEITKIQEYIETSKIDKPVENEDEGRANVDLIKRKFDEETAKIIERDLLDTPPYNGENRNESFNNHQLANKENNKTVEAEPTESGSVLNPQHVAQEEDEVEIELSNYECSEDTKNYMTCHYDDTKDVKSQVTKLKDKFSMEVCIDDGIVVRLRATPFSLLFDQEPKKGDKSNQKEIESTVRSEQNNDLLHTPFKDPVKSQCYEIFDSTLTSIDTPFKDNSPQIIEASMKSETKILVEEVVIEEKIEPKKRKRVQSGSVSDESGNENKRAKSETQYLLNSASIQNIDIESVLSKLHGP